MNTNCISYIMEYLPKRFSATPKQENDRQTIYAFKNGFCSLELKKLIVEHIKTLKDTMSGNNIRVCFIPASTLIKTINRYKDLATYIEKETGIACNVETILPGVDHEAGHICGKAADPTKDFKFKSEDINGKNIILMDDVITRGITYLLTARRLKKLGAKDIRGLFLAKTINPDWVHHCA